MLSDRPKIGLFFMAAQFFWDRGLASISDESAKSLSQVVEEDAQAIVDTLQERMGVVCPGIVRTVAEAEAAAAEFKKSEIDLLVICHLMWSEDQPLLKLLNEMEHVPLVVWCYSPYDKLPRTLDVTGFYRATGACGTLQVTGPLVRMGRDFEFVIGNQRDAELVETVYEHAEARKLAKELKETTIGLLPARWEVMTDIYVDEFRLMSQIGPTVQHISVAELSAASGRIEEADVAARVDELRDKYEVCGVKEKTLRVATRASLGLARVADEFNVDALAFNENAPELHREIGLNPALYVPELYEGGRVVGMEGDLGTTTALLILGKLTGKPSMFLEVFSFDLGDNSFMAGHCGQQNVNLAGGNERVKVVPDVEYENSPEAELEGAWMQFMLPEGRVTMLQLVCGADNFKMIIAGGGSLGGEVRLPGFPQAHIRPDVPIAEFFTQMAQVGATHHLAVVHGDVVSKLEKLADVLGVRKVVIG